ncbi:Uncharacterized protein HZ326_10827 [Fusarium oxysporum f. sp. albedinis]|nr:Uncharacterized protein HZ326_10827 [Fusarium oxysporum f. sp. albedinis]
METGLIRLPWLNHEITPQTALPWLGNSGFGRVHSGAARPRGGLLAQQAARAWVRSTNTAQSNSPTSACGLSQINKTCFSM